MIEQQHKVLLVEDEPVTHRAICRVFEKNRYKYTGVTKLSDAIDQVKSENYDIIISDVRLPDGSGLDLLDMVNSWLLTTPFVVITASEDKMLVHNALKKGATDFLSKPFNLKNLPTIIDRNIQRKRMEHERNNSRNASVLLKAIKALVSALEAKDSYTSGHSLRVAHYARMMGEVMDLDNEQQFSLYLSALLHDIGKIGLPDHILHKESTLLEQEYITAQEHPLIGSRIVGNIDELSEVASVIRHHHERYDGRGYPDCLTGDAIPLLSRILAIVDTYEAIVSRRIYRDRQSPELAVLELLKNAGTQFDPSLVNIFVKLIKNPEFHIIHESTYAL